MTPEASNSNETATREPHSLRRRKKEKASRLQCAILFILVLLVFSPLLFSGELWNKNDLASASGFHEISSWTKAWHPSQLRAYDPFSRSSYFLEQALPLKPAFSHRLINIALHLLAVFFLWSFLRKMRLTATWLATLIFALHPSVIPVLFWPGHRHVLIGFVLLLAVLNLSASQLTTKRYLLLIALTTLGLLIHPNFIFLPLILALLTYKRSYPTRITDYNWILPMLCICLFAGAWLSNKSAFDAGPFVLSEWSFKAGHYMQYLLRQTFVPLNLEFYRAIPSSISYSVATGINLAPFLLFPPFVILGLLNRKHQWARNLLFGVICYFFLALSPIVAGGEFIDGTEAFELYSYYFALAVICVSSILALRKITAQLGLATELLFRIVIYALLGLECIFSFTNACEARDSSKIWHNIYKQWPQSSDAQIAYVESVLESESKKVKKDTLILLMQSLLEQAPERIEVRKLLARTLRDAGQLNNALREYRRVLLDESEDLEFLSEAADFLEYQSLEFEARKVRERIQGASEEATESTRSVP